MRIISTALLICLSCAFFYAQDKQETVDIKSQFTLDDGCGDTSYESQLYDNREGKITKIISPNEVVFKQIVVNGNKKKRTFTVELVGIDPSQSADKIKEFLGKYILNQNVEITGNLLKSSDKKFKGEIFAASDDEDDIDWINVNLLEFGIAKYKDFNSANLVPFNLPCQLQKAEAKAKAAKLGIWAK